MVTGFERGVLMIEKSMELFLEELSSAAPVPGGGGASAAAGAMSAALGSMVGNLTTGKKKYAEYQSEIEEIIAKAGALRDDLKTLVEKDAEVFEPLAKAYSIPKDEPGRDEILESCLKTAASAPYEMVVKTCETARILERLAVIGSRLAISDVGVGAALCRSAAEGAAMNVYINTKLMKDRAYAEDLNEKTIKAVAEVRTSCDETYETVRKSLMGE
jgi:formiminotetrahydrofolate cyclodeaminase